MAMTINELIAAVQKTVVTKEDMEKLRERLNEADRLLEEKRMIRERDPQGFLNFQYTL
jgi:hypothetical protein